MSVFIIIFTCITTRAVLDTSIQWCIVTEIGQSDINAAVSISWHVRSSGLLLIWIQERHLKLRKVQGFKKIMNYVLLILVNLATMCTHSLSTVDKLAGFLKTPVRLQNSNLHFDNLFSEKCNSSTVHLRERDSMHTNVCMNYHNLYSFSSEALALIDKNNDVASSLLRGIM